MTLDEFFEDANGVLLRNNLESNLDQLDLKKEDKEFLMRINLIMIRQYIEDVK